MTRGFRRDGIAQVADVLSGHVAAGRLPGAVFGLSRGGETRVEAVGSAAAGGPAMPGDALFRITSMTRPVTAAAALMLAGRGRLSLDEPVDRLLPELAGQPVLRRLDGPVEDTVPARSPVTVRDLLTLRGGFGFILAPPEDYPILAAEAELGLRSVGPPVPATVHAPDEWIRRMGTLPLMDQPGTQWRYGTGSMILGVLVARAAEQPLGEFLAAEIFGPLGMTSTSFTVLPDAARVLPACYQFEDGALRPFDDGGAWSRPPAFPDGGGGLLSTARDYLAFARMVLRGGVHDGGVRLLSPDLAAQMTTDQLSAAQRDAGGLFLDGRGWGFGLSVIPAPPPPARGPKGYGWSGGFGTVWLNDPAEGLAAVLCTQLMASAEGAGVESDFWAAVYAALED